MDHGGEMAFLLQPRRGRSEVQEGNSAQIHLFGDECIKGLSQTQFVEAYLDGHFPQTGNAQKRLMTVVFDERWGCPAEIGVTADEPQEAISRTDFVRTQKRGC